MHDEEKFGHEHLVVSVIITKFSVLLSDINIKQNL